MLLERALGLSLANAASLALALVLALAPLPARAQVGASFNRTGSGARAAGMANAFIAISDDGTAASWNPGGLAQLRKPELSLVSTTAGDEVTAAGFRTRDDLAAFASVRSTYRNTYPDFASLAVPATLFGKPVTFQAAWRRLYSLDYRELSTFTREPLAPEGPPAARFTGNRDTVGSVDLVSLAGAVKLTSRLALGASVNFWRGDWEETHSISETPLEPPGPTRFETFGQTNRVRGETLALGLLLSYPRFSAGLVYQGALDADYSGSQFRVASDLEHVSQSFEGTLDFPASFGLGGAWRPAGHWTLALDLTFDDWKEAILDTDVTGRVNLFDGLPPDRSSTRDTLSINAGAEHLFTAEGFVLPLRFGVAWEPQGARDPYTRDPVDFKMVAIGAGYNTNSLKLDAAFQYRWTSFKDGAEFGTLPASPLLPSAVGEQTISQWRLKLSLILRVTNTATLKQTARKVLGAVAPRGSALQHARVATAPPAARR